MSFNEQDIVRDSAGRFDEKNHSAPEVGLVSGASPVTRDIHAEALAALEDLLQGQGEDVLDAAREHMQGSQWRPNLYFIGQGDGLDTTLGAFIAGDDEKVDDLLSALEDNNWEDETRICEEMFPGVWDDIDDDTQVTIRQWLHDYDESDPIGDMVGQTGRQLMQVQIADDQEFGAALQAASKHPEASQERYGAIEDAFMNAITAAGGQDTEANREAIRTLIDENDLTAGHQHQEQWRLRVLTYDDIGDYSRSLYSSLGDQDRDITLHGAHLLLIDPWNGRGMDAKLEGPITARITEDRPARLDSDLGFGSWDEVAGVVKSAYQPDFAPETRVLERAAA